MLLTALQCRQWRHTALSGIRRFVASHLWRRLRLDPRPLLDLWCIKKELDRCVSECLCFPPVSIITPILRTQSFNFLRCNILLASLNRPLEVANNRIQRAAQRSKVLICIWEMPVTILVKMTRISWYARSLLRNVTTTVPQTRTPMSLQRSALDLF